MEEAVRENPDVEKVLRGVFVLVKILEEGLAVVAQMLGERGMRSQMGFWDLHLESATDTELH